MKIYYITAYTGQWAHRRLAFKDYDAAMDYARTERENEDVVEVWMTVFDTERTGSYGSLEIESNEPIEF